MAIVAALPIAVLPALASLAVYNHIVIVGSTTGFCSLCTVCLYAHSCVPQTLVRRRCYHPTYALVPRRPVVRWLCVDQGAMLLLPESTPLQLPLNVV